VSNSHAVASQRANALAERLEQGSKALADFAEGLSDAEWNTEVSGDGRTVGIVVHHVASVYPVEIELAQAIASGKAVTGVTMDVIADMNASHAEAHANIDKQETIDLLLRNSRLAADSLRAFSDAQLDSAVPVSLYADAPLTAQFFIEDHALRHSYHHLGKMRSTLKR
jgi:hypothetical protein